MIDLINVQIDSDYEKYKWVVNQSIDQTWFKPLTFLFGVLIFFVKMYLVKSNLKTKLTIYINMDSYTDVFLCNLSIFYMFFS